MLPLKASIFAVRDYGQKGGTGTWLCKVGRGGVGGFRLLKDLEGERYF